jgi:dienelactone hydrolase
VIAILSVVCVTLLGQTRAPVHGPDEPIRALADAVDWQDPGLRRKAALDLATRKEVSIDDWIRDAASLPPWEVVEGCGMPAPDYAGPPRGFGWKPNDAGPQSITAALAVSGPSRLSKLQLYLPRSRPTRSAPLLVVFHGTEGTGADVEPMWRETADAIGMLVLAPTDTGKNEGYTYSEREREEALGAIRWMRRNFDVDPDRIYATGISRGGHLAWDLALRHPDLFAAIAPMIGGPRFQLDHGQNNLRFLENVVSLPIRDLQGAKDDPALVGNVRVAFKKLEKLGARDAKLFEFPELGHSFDFAAVDWKDFFGKAKRDPIPDRVVLLASKAEGARAFWVEITKLAKEVSEDVVPTVTASTWKGLDENGRRDFLESEVEKRTARLEVKMTAPGRFTATGEHVVGFRLLLAKSMFDPSKPVQVLFGGRLVEKKVVPDAKVLLGEFVERFDRSFLPVAAIDVP